MPATQNTANNERRTGRVHGGSVGYGSKADADGDAERVGYDGSSATQRGRIPTTKGTQADGPSRCHHSAVLGVLGRSVRRKQKYEDANGIHNVPAAALVSFATQTHVWSGRHDHAARLLDGFKRQAQRGPWNDE